MLIKNSETGYDAAGRRVSMFDTRLTTDTVGGQTFTWGYDKLDRMTTETYPDGSVVAWSYDALGRRIGRESGDGVTRTRYNYDGLNILMTRESSPATGGAWRTRKAYTLKQADIGQIIAEHTATAWASNGAPSVWTHQFYHFDLLGNTTAQTDSNGWVTNIIDMEAFGTVLEGGQAGFRLTTKEYDPEAGAYYFNARWYDSVMGVFLQPAFLHVTHEPPYLTSWQNPVAYFDNDGNFAFILKPLFSCAIGAGTSWITRNLIKPAVGMSRDNGSCEDKAELYCSLGAGCIAGMLGGAIVNELKNKIASAGGGMIAKTLGGAVGGIGVGMMCKEPCEAIADNYCEFKNSASQRRIHEEFY